MATANNNTKRPHDLGILAMLVHTNAVRHGWWENQLSDEHYLTLVISELAEAVEADRKDSKADKESFEITLADWQDEAEREADPEQWRYEFNAAFGSYIKDTVADELADTVIRLLDLAGARKCKIYNVGTVVGCINKSQTFTENVWQVIRILTRSDLTTEQRIISGIVCVEILAALYDIDLWWHVLLKMEFNTGRPYKHNKKY